MNGKRLSPAEMERALAALLRESFTDAQHPACMDFVRLLCEASMYLLHYDAQGAAATLEEVMHLLEEYVE
ncbi:MAG: hypothetical protein Q8P59_10020 [Dehalococcoidia bacterium]|nr:hypothetical protein [Dehalococcoidia bacterium]